MGVAGCKSSAAVHFSPSFCPIAGLRACKSGKNCPRWGRFSLSAPQARQPPRTKDTDFHTIGPDDYSGAWPHGVSAHSKVDERTGEFIFFNYSFNSKPYMQYGVVGPDNKLICSTEIDLPGPRLPHDSWITENYTILHDLPIRGQSGTDRSVDLARPENRRRPDSAGLAAPGGARRIARHLAQQRRHSSRPGAASASCLRLETERSNLPAAANLAEETLMCLFVAWWMAAPQKTGGALVRFARDRAWSWVAPTANLKRTDYSDSGLAGTCYSPTPMPSGWRQGRR